ncbi:thiol reductant ABC exporter subunit CydC [Paenibacillus motobuensis]|uniref:thiol reductant ABC exporter subunit CydC n=1 Tax=Paenibacillus TaxID=44249 RepID=UPI00203D3D75|nr:MULTISPECIES: thiol reductant ABC exporter subunit CydC [Paenibacillus]MCM3041057.1 thiol reductant ABC exporter subunit CydC [Paenibacillus lutimineralis]MCM3648161.1 thiol reductant ABC exporter subunit CydC [Paenibacillus motobuensis]
MKDNLTDQGWITPYFRLYSGRFALYLILGVLTLLSASMLMFTSGYLITKSSTMPYNILLVYVPIVGVRAFGIGRSVIHYVERLVGHDAVLRILSRMRVRLYRVLEPQALFIRSRYRTGDILGALADDIEQLQNVYIRTVFPSLVAIVLYATVVVALGMFDVVFALLVALYILILVALLPYISLRLTRRTNAEVKRERNGLYQQLTDAVMGIGDWVISGRHHDFLTDYERAEAIVANKERKLHVWSRWRGLIGQLVIGLAAVAMIYWSTGQAAAGHIDPTLIAAFVLVVFPLADAFLPVADAVERIPEYKESLDRLVRMEGQSGEGSGDNSLNKSSHRTEGSLGSALQAHLKLEHVKFAYEEEGANSVDGVSIDIPQGKRIAVIGRSGAGKSTLLKLIQGALEPLEGSVMINDRAAVDYGEEIPRLISVLNQSPHLFDTTVANNILLGRPEASEEEILRAAEQARMGELIASLPEGLNTPMRETGQRFSGGEQQRIALARVLLQNTPVLILDEPTVGLDPRTERALLSTIFQATSGKSLIWVTHHLVGAEHMDEIIFMEHGRIIMRGTHAELMEREPRYRNLYHLDRPVSISE